MTLCKDPFRSLDWAGCYLSFGDAVIQERDIDRLKTALLLCFACASRPRLCQGMIPNARQAIANPSFRVCYRLTTRQVKLLQKDSPFWKWEGDNLHVLMYAHTVAHAALKVSRGE